METTLAVISDLHVGKNDEFDIFRAPDKLEIFDSFLSSLHQNPTPVELVINGDVVDFLQLRSWDDWSRESALSKMREIVSCSAGVFRSLGAFLRDSPHRIKVLLGNHDVELAYSEVADVLRQAILGEASSACDRFELINRRTTYNPRVNGVLVHLEHGNATDPWNAINYGPLFQAAELGTNSFAYPPGTQFVYQTINRFKDQLRFVDVLKPEVPAVPLLLLALRPWQAIPALPEAAVMSLRAVGNGLLAAVRQRLAGSQLDAASGPKPDSQAQSAEQILVAELSHAIVGTTSQETPSPATLAAMAQDLELLLGDGLDEAAGKEQVLAARNPMAVRLATSALQGLHRFGAIQLGESKASLYAQSGDPFSHAAQAALVGDVRIVVFGHTHEALVAEFREGIYVNSGAWANVVRLPASADRKSIVAWLKGIENNSFEVTAAPTYVLVEPGGSGVTVSLNQWTQNGKRSLWSKHISR